MAKKCLCEAHEVLIFPCSGASNVGQIANQAAIQLTKDGTGNMYCLAGIGAHLDAMIEAAKTAKRIVAIDGCSAECSKKTLENGGVKVTDHIDVVKAGITKNSNLKASRKDVTLVAQRVKASLKK